MTKPSTSGREHQPDRPIELVCVSQHAHPGAVQKEPDELTMLRGKWAWCPFGAGAGHEWQPVEAGSLNALRAQLVEVSRLVDVALDKPRESPTAPKIKGPRPRAKRR